MSVFDTIKAQTDRLDDATLVASLALLDKPTVTQEERIVRAAICETLEQRHDVAAQMDAWADDLESTLTYSAALLAALAVVEVAA